MQTTIEEKQLRLRFVNDMGLPIQVIQSPYFEERIALLGEEEKYKAIVDLINSNYNGNISKWLEYYHAVREAIIQSILNSDAFKEFNDSKIRTVSSQLPSRNLYTNEQDGCLFITYDMKKANFQALRYANPEIVLGAETYEDFIGEFTDSDYIKKSKYTRQVIFGKTNPKKTIALEKYLTNEFVNEFSDEFKNFELFSINSDEVIFKFIGNEEDFDKIVVNDKTSKEGIKFTVSKFKLHSRIFKLETSESNLTVFEKEDFLNGHKRTLKCVPSTYMTQIYKLINGLEITQSDLVFYYEHELCQFMNPIKLIK